MVPCSWHSAGVLALSWGQRGHGKKVSPASAQDVQEGAGTGGYTRLAKAKALQPWCVDYLCWGYSVGFAPQMARGAPVLEIPQAAPIFTIPSGEAEPRLQPDLQAQPHWAPGEPLTRSWQQPQRLAQPQLQAHLPCTTLLQPCHTPCWPAQLGKKSQKLPGKTGEAEMISSQCLY